MNKATVKRKVMVVVGVVTVLAEGVVVAARRGGVFRLDTVVRCRDGHLFTTYWIPGASFKALRLGWWRLQWCPVGRHWSMVTPVWSDELSEDQRQQAAEAHDLRIP